MTGSYVTNGKTRGFDPVKIPTTIVASLIRDTVDELGLEVFCQRARVTDKTVSRILNGATSHVGFSVADDLVTHGLGDSSLWHTEPELSRLYGRPDRLRDACASGSPVGVEEQVRAVVRMLDRAALRDSTAPAPTLVEADGAGAEGGNHAIDR